MGPWLETSLPCDASAAEARHLIGPRLQHETGHLPVQVQVIPCKDGPVYAVVATYEEPV
jgi:hypothetical protein